MDIYSALHTDSQEFIAEIEAKDGKNIEIKITTVSNEVEGQIKSISAFLTDVTTQISANGTTSLVSKGLCESFIEHNRDPILLLDLDAVIVSANRSFSDLLGWRKENLEGFHILRCPSIPADLIEQMGDYFRRVVHGETKLEMLETVRMDTEGKSHFMKFSVTPIQDAKGEVCNWAVHLRPSLTLVIKKGLVKKHESSK
jgi:PAS domain S-box-containing protein